MGRLIGQGGLELILANEPVANGQLANEGVGPPVVARSGFESGTAALAGDRFAY